jgi:hypothetical protein
MNTTMQQKPVSNHNEIASLAWQIWLAEAGQPGRVQEYWLKAEQQLRAASHPEIRPANDPFVKRKGAVSAGKKRM